MLQSAKKLNGFSIAATDGNIGHIKDVYLTTRSGPYAISWSIPAAGFRAGKS
jgi:hypothetical protein